MTTTEHQEPTPRDIVDRVVEWWEQQAVSFVSVWEEGLDAPLSDWAVVIFFSSAALVLTYLAINGLTSQASSSGGGGFVKGLAALVAVFAVLFALYNIPGLYFESAMESKLGSSEPFEPPTMPPLPDFPSR